MDHDKCRVYLSALRDGELDENFKDLVSRHLQSCDACCKELRELERMDALVGGIPGIRVPETFAAEIMARTRAVRSQSSRELRLPKRVADWFALAVDSILEFLPGNKSQGTGTLAEFGDFPPLSLSHAYFNLIGQ